MCLKCSGNLDKEVKSLAMNHECKSIFLHYCRLTTASCFKCQPVRQQRPMIVWILASESAIKCLHAKLASQYNYIYAYIYIHTSTYITCILIAMQAYIHTFDESKNDIYYLHTYMHTYITYIHTLHTYVRVSSRELSSFAKDLRDVHTVNMPTVSSLS